MRELYFSPSAPLFLGKDRSVDTDCPASFSTNSASASVTCIKQESPFWCVSMKSNVLIYSLQRASSDHLATGIDGGACLEMAGRLAS